MSGAARAAAYADVGIFILATLMSAVLCEWIFRRSSARRQKDLRKALMLGPMPETVREAVNRLINERRSQRIHSDERLNGLLLAGGPGGASHLDGEGEVWNLHYAIDRSDDVVIEHVPDGPMKVGLVAVAAERMPELAAWLPTRPPAAEDCATCAMKGWLQPPLPRLLCPHCQGMGWRPR
ncbi:MAG: hypothetical protein U0744_01140 [Gemmataceae bacterium]